MKKNYSAPSTELIKTNVSGKLMNDWVSTKISDDEISDDEFNSKKSINDGPGHEDFNPWKN